MRVGYQVGQVVLRDTVDHQQQWQNHLEQFRASRDAGFDIYCWAHHYLIDPFQHFQPWPVLARLAGEPGTMKLATSVLLLPLLNPVEVAEQVATLDQISEGRFIFGVGLGYRPEECEAFGTRMSQRGARITESMGLMRRLWTEDEVTLHGKFFNVTNARPTARTYQNPYPKVWQAAMSDPAVRRVGREGDILYIGPAQSKEAIRHQIQLYHDTLDENGNPVPGDMAIIREFYYARTHEEALEKAKRGFAKKYEVYAQHGLHGTDGELTKKVTGDLETLMDDTFLVGTPEECIEQIAAYHRMGFTDVSLRLFYPEMSQSEVLEHIDLVGQEVIPALPRSLTRTGLRTPEKTLELGVIFPQTEIEPDPGAVRDFAQAAEDLGYSYLFIADHVLGADPAHHNHPSYATYNHRSVVHESLTLMGYLAGVTNGLGLATGILILPQRQTALVAKQAAEVDLLCGGRLRLGIGVGWNEVEFEALGENFHDRGARSAEQITVMRELWTKEVVDFHGKWHDITHAGINPLPVQRPIPVWMGSGSATNPMPPDSVLRRVARLADGWCPNFSPDETGRALMAKVSGYMSADGRDLKTLGLDGRLKTADRQPEDWIDEVRAWQEMGATHISVENRRRGLSSAGEHIEAMRRFKDAVEF